MKIIRNKDQTVLVARCELADSFLPRLKGWMGKRSASADEGLWFPRCSSVHMWWMSMAIDIVFFSAVGEGRYRVTSVHSRVRAWKPLPLWDLRASDVLELAEGSIERLRLQVGEEVVCSS